ncbi:MAG: type II toxin-antitoxin system CcdA family antitoxin [Cytophagales bacterium]
MRKRDRNTSKAAGQGVLKAIKFALEKKWREDNKDAIQAHNKRIEDNGPLLTPYWLSN